MFLVINYMKISKLKYIKISKIALWMDFDPIWKYRGGVKKLSNWLFVKDGGLNAYMYVYLLPLQTHKNKS